MDPGHLVMSMGPEPLWITIVPVDPGMHMGPGFLWMTVSLRILSIFMD